MSYLFIAIVWTNHHYLMRYATEATPRLLWFNFAHLFSLSLLPLSTAWMAVSELAPQPVSFYGTIRSSCQQVPKPSKRDIPGATVRFFDTGPFALETHAEQIAKAIQGFLVH